MDILSHFILFLMTRIPAYDKVIRNSGSYMPTIIKTNIFKIKKSCMFTEKVQKIDRNNAKIIPY